MKKQDFIDTISELFLQNKDSFNINKFMTIEDILKQASLDIIMKYPSKYDDWTNYVTPDTPNLEQFTIEKCKSLLASRKDFLDEFKRVKNNGEKLSDFKNIYATKETELLKNIPAFIIAKFGDDRKELAFGLLKNILSQSERRHPIATQNYFDENNEIGQWIKNNGFMDDFIHWGQGKFFTGKDDKYKKFVEQKPMRKIMSFNGLLVIYENKLFDYEVNIEAVAKSSVDKIIDFPDQDIQKLVDTHSSEDEEPVKQIIALFCQKNLLEPNNVKIKGKIEFTQEHEDVLKQYNLQHLINKINTNKQSAKQLKVNL